MFKKTLCAIVLAASAANMAESRITISPVANISLMGGQYWVSDSMPSSMAANFDIYFAPVVNFSKDAALLPIYTGYYSGTKDVRELVGGGTLTRQIQDHSLTLKYVQKYGSGWKFKGRAGYKMEYLNETSDETWGKGLFDYRKTNVGIEAEKICGNNSFHRFGMDVFAVSYPNYSSLFTDAGFSTSIDTTTYSEISNNAGSNVLDYNGATATYEYSRQFSPQLAGTIHYDISIKSFGDQRIVNNTGMFSTDKRTDLSHYLSLNGSFSAERLVLSVTEGALLYGSNQNSMDAASPQFTAKSYDYFQNDVAPSLTVYLGNIKEPVRLILFWNFSYRQYVNRLAQNALAQYSSDKINQLYNTTGMTLLYPVAPRLSARFSSTYMDASSNMRYEKNYKYNYYTLNYFVGINWQY